MELAPASQENGISGLVGSQVHPFCVSPAKDVDTVERSGGSWPSAQDSPRTTWVAVTAATTNQRSR